MRNRLRPLLAALLAFVLPGLGHVLVRRWGRALVWHGTIVGGTIALYLLYDVEPIDPLAAPSTFATAVPLEVSLPVAVLVTLSAIDAYLIGREDETAAARAEAAEAVIRRRSSADDDAAWSVIDESSPAEGAVTADAPAGDEVPSAIQCPNCGRETDAEIDFCHWCTEPLPWADDE
ncbi:DUF7575 domain-containing protein [Halorubrum sp. DTA98]|uniref:DUF7575 domain-containing protein n=1 Tax=Halorubrum sp. DTA98 TaxID=3402163 RepID=UPI003AADEC90